MKRTTSERDPQAVNRLRELIAGISVAMVTTVTSDGALRSRPMMTQDIRGETELWFFTSDEAGQAHDLADEQGVNVSYSDPIRGRYVSVSGNATVVRDSEKIHELWRPAMARFFPRGLDDPHLALICVRIETAEYWDEAASRMVAMPGGSRSAGEKSATPPETHTQVDIRATRASG